MRLGASLVLAAAVLLPMAFPASAQEGARPITLVVGYGPGGGYDAYARIIARHMPRFLPGKPTITVQNMPGASSLRAANYLYNAAPRDGSFIGTFSRDIAVLGVLGHNKSVQYDPMKFTWLGSASSYRDDAYMLWVRRDASARFIANPTDASAPPVVLGVTNEGGGGNDVALFLKEIARLNVRLVPGYPDSNALFLAMQRSEIEARLVGLSAVRTSQPAWLASDSPVTPVLQLGRPDRHPNFPETPMARELISDPQARLLIDFLEAPFAFSKPFVAPPGVPESVAGALRRAFMDSLKDETTLQDFARLKADVSPKSADELLRILDHTSAAPASVKEQARDLLAHGT